MTMQPAPTSKSLGRERFGSHVNAKTVLLVIISYRLKSTLQLGKKIFTGKFIGSKKSTLQFGAAETTRTRDGIHLLHHCSVLLSRRNDLLRSTGKPSPFWGQSPHPPYSVAARPCTKQRRWGAEASKKGRRVRPTDGRGLACGLRAPHGSTPYPRPGKQGS